MISIFFDLLQLFFFGHLDRNRRNQLQWHSPFHSLSREFSIPMIDLQSILHGSSWRIVQGAPERHWRRIQYTCERAAGACHEIPINSTSESGHYGSLHVIPGTVCSAADPPNCMIDRVPSFAFEIC